MFWCKRSSVPVNGGHHLKCSRPCSSFFGDADAGVVALSYAQSMTHQLQGSLTFYPSKVLTCHWWKLDYSQFFTILFATMLLKTMVMTHDMNRPKEVEEDHATFKTTSWTIISNVYLVSSFSQSLFPAASLGHISAGAFHVAIAWSC